MSSIFVWSGALFVALVLVALAVTGHGVSDEEMLQQQYCEMVDIWDRSKGEYGWPPYRGRELCN